MKELIIHVGLPKTATSTLQTNVFMVLHREGVINFLGRSNTIFDEEYYNPIGLYLNKLYDVGENSDEFKIIKKDILSLLVDNKVNVISEECMSLTHDIDYKSFFKNVAAVFSDYNIEIIYSIRNYKEFLISYYVEMYRWKYHSIEKMNSIDKFIVEVIKNYKSSDFDILFYNRFYNQLKLNFENINIINFEDFKLNNKPYELISKKLGVDCSLFYKMFNDKRLNTRKYSSSGKYNEAITLNQRISKVVSFLGDSKLVKYLKNNYCLRCFYSFILKKTQNIKVSKEKEHVVFHGDNLDKLVLLMDKEGIKK